MPPPPHTRAPDARPPDARASEARAPEARARAIIEEARRQFVSKGYAATRIEPIAREAAVSTATLYTFFESKQALFEAVIQDAATEFTVKMSAIQNDGLNTRSDIATYIEQYCELITDPFVRHMFRLVVSERPRFADLASDFFDRRRGDVLGSLVKALENTTRARLTQIDNLPLAANQLLAVVEHHLLFVPLTTGQAPSSKRSAGEIAQDAVDLIWARYSTTLPHSFSEAPPETLTEVRVYG